MSDEKKVKVKINVDEVLMEKFEERLWGLRENLAKAKERYRTALEILRSNSAVDVDALVASVDRIIRERDVWRSTEEISAPAEPVGPAWRSTKAEEE